MVFKLRKLMKEWLDPAPMRHPGLDEPFTPAATDAERMALLTRWREIAAWTRTVPQGRHDPAALVERTRAFCPGAHRGLRSRVDSGGRDRQQRRRPPGPRG